ncbi:hypothetical protein ACFP4H_22745 [Pseudophaeobacter arcticus]|uniref:hypothetical protein n=1 Tax=Pseudophaeobacter arcticus TaxID=385492 RepID=UPI00048859A9|nr:hypothetical protein [Pseudophaeobacter arcticus]
MAIFDPIPHDGGYRYSIRDEASNKIYVVFVTREMLDDAVGDNRTDEQSISWMRENEAELHKAWSARVFGGPSIAPFNRIFVREES